MANASRNARPEAPSQPGATEPSDMRDRLDSMETELAGHPAFGDAQSIFDRLRAGVLLFLEGAAKGRPLIQALHQELRDGPHQQAAAVFADPAVLSGLLGRSSNAMANPGSEESEELVAATLRHLRSGALGLPTAAGCRLRARPRCVQHDIALWDPALTRSVFKRSFESAFDKCIGSSFPRRARLRRPSPALVKVVERGCELLAALLPELATSALAHLRLIGFFSIKDYRYTGQVTNISISSTTFLHGAHWRTPWLAAEALLHEALHCKLGHLARVRGIHREGGNAGAPAVIRPFWKRGQRPSEAEWTPMRAFAAFHVYVHLALFWMRVERLEARLAGEFEAPPASFRESLRAAFDRADYLRRALEDVDRPLGSEGRLMFAWLSRVLQRLSDSA